MTPEERFDKKFAELPIKVFFALNGRITPIIKNFIQSEIKLAKEKEQNRIVGIIKEDQKKYDGMPHDIVHDKLISLITTK